MDKAMRFWSDDRGSNPLCGIYFYLCNLTEFFFFNELYDIPSIYNYH